MGRVLNQGDQDCPNCPHCDTEISISGNHFRHYGSSRFRFLSPIAPEPCESRAIWAPDHSGIVGTLSCKSTAAICRSPGADSSDVSVAAVPIVDGLSFAELAWDEADFVTDVHSLAYVPLSADTLSRKKVDVADAHSDSLVDVAVVVIVVVTISCRKLGEGLSKEAAFESGDAIA
jgi:hypothetical protein